MNPKDDDLNDGNVTDGEPLTDDNDDVGEDDLDDEDDEATEGV